MIKITPFKEFDHTIQKTVNSEALRQNVKMIVIHKKQLEKEKYNLTDVQRLKNLFRKDDH